MNSKIGYACINMHLGEQDVSVNRSMTQTYFLKHGKKKALPLLSGRILSNMINLNRVLEWNLRNDIYFYRMSSVMFSLEHLYELEELPDWPQIQYQLKKAGNFAKENNMRLSFHPGPFNVLASKSQAVIDKTILNLNFHSRIMDEMGLSKTHYNPINIHIGGAFGDKIASMERFASNWDLLDENTKLRLNVENDDRRNMFSAKDLMYLHNLIEIPICFDYLHHKFCHSDQSEEEALKMCYNTWPKGINPVVHVASSILIEQKDSGKMARAHADYLYEEFDNYGLQIDYMVEAKMKEKALLKWRNQYKLIKS